jgi:hypothetical protein
LRRLIAAGLVLAVASVTLTACASETGVARTTVDGDGFSVSLDGVTAHGGAGVAPGGTAVALSQTDHRFPEDIQDQVLPLADPIELALEGGLQPATPITVSFEINPVEISQDEWAVPETVLLLTESREGGLDLIPATLDGTELTAVTDHLSWFQPIQFDLESVVDGARDLLLQSLGIEYPEPECSGATASADGLEYSIGSAWAAWPCISADGDRLTVDIHPNTAIPFRLKSTPASEGQTHPGLDKEGVLLAVLSRLIEGPLASGSLMAAGARVTFTFDAAAPPTSISLRQDPAMLIAAVLLTVLDTLLPKWGSGFVLTGSLDELECLGDVVETGLGAKPNVATVAKFVGAFFSCAGVLVADAAALPVRFLFTLVAAVPALFSSAFIGLINEFTGQGNLRIPVTGKPAEGTWTVGFTHIGPVEIGETIESLSGRFPGLSAEDVSGGLGMCGGGWWDEGSAWQGLNVLAESQGFFGPVDTVGLGMYPPPAQHAYTGLGIGIGSSREAVLTAYPGARESPHVYVQGGSYIDVENGSGFAMRFGTDAGGRVEQVNVGRIPQVYWVEGCL